MWPLWGPWWPQDQLSQGRNPGQGKNSPGDKFFCSQVANSTIVFSFTLISKNLPRTCRLWDSRAHKPGKLPNKIVQLLYGFLPHIWLMTVIPVLCNSPWTEQKECQRKALSSFLKSTPGKRLIWGVQANMHKTAETDEKHRQILILSSLGQKYPGSQTTKQLSELWLLYP